MMKPMLGVIECFKSDRGDIVAIGRGKAGKTVLQLSSGVDKDGADVTIAVSLTQKELARVMRAMIARLTGSEDELNG